MTFALSTSSDQRPLSSEPTLKAPIKVRVDQVKKTPQ